MKMDSFENSNKMKDDGGGSDSKTEIDNAQKSNEIFIASGPYFAQFNGSVVGY